MEPGELKAWRKQLRAELIDARIALDAATHRTYSEAVTSAVLNRVDLFKGKLLGFYWPFRREFNPLPIVKRHLELGGRAALPTVVAKNQPLEFRAWSPGTKMEVGVYDIPFPAEGPGIEPDALLVALVGFDAGGYRLGYGGGFYDRTLGSYKTRPLTIGVGFELCRLETIHPQTFDVPLDYIATERGLFHRHGHTLAPGD